MAAVPRENAEWVAAVAADGPEGDVARRELRSILVRSLRRMLAARGVAEDMCEDFAQDALVRVRERVADFRGESQFVTWALAIATRLAFDELRHKRWKDVSFESVVEGADAPLSFEVARDASSERSVARDRVLGLLARVIEHELTEKQRRVLSAELAGMPHAEIAVHLGMSRNALYKLAHDARRRVKTQLEAAGVLAADVIWIFE